LNKAKITDCKGVSLIDTFSYGAFHELFNACFYLIVINVFDNITYIVSKSQYKHIVSLLKKNGYETDSNVKIKHVFVKKENRKYSFILRFFISSIIDLKYLFLEPKRNLLIFNINNAFSLFPIKFLNIFLQKKILIINHGELELLTDKKPGTRFGRIQKVFLKIGFKFDIKSDNIFFLVLGDHIAKYLVTHGYAKQDNILVLDHPVMPNNQISYLNEEKSYLNLGTVGSLFQSKGIDKYAQLVNKVNGKLSVNWHIIGRCTNEMTPEKYPFIHFHAKENKFMKRSEMDKLISRLDYMLFFYPDTHYQLMASGAVYDAIIYEKPIIAIKNDYFVYLFEKYGAFGYLCNNIDEMINVIEQLSIIHTENSNFKINMQKIKKMHSVEYLSDRLLKELSKLCDNFVKKRICH
jgi:hypothetical protein